MVHMAATNELTAKVMEHPKLAAELLHKHNPCDTQVAGWRFLQPWELRLP